MKKLLSLSLVASSLLLADTDLEQLKKQMDKQQLIIQKLQEKIQNLESEKLSSEQKRIQKLEAIIAKQEQRYEEKTPKQVVLNTAGSSSSFSQSAFVPNISLILDTSYVSRNKEDDIVSNLNVPGVVNGLLGTTADGDSTFNANNGFNFNYAEMAISSSVDPFFRMDAIFHIREDGVEIDEAYFTSTALGYGLRAKAGKFRSNFGYLNEKHHHQLNFGDVPLVYESFLGIHGISEIGLQLQWTAPTSTYLMLGAEVLQGNNARTFGNKSIGDAENPVAKASTAPALLVAYAKSSVDIGDTTVFGGISYANGSARVDNGSSVFSGDSSLYGADLLVKHYFDSYSSLTWQSELLMRDMDGKDYNLNDDGTVFGNQDLRKKQSGLYTQLIYGINQSWKIGAKYDTIYQNDVIRDAVNQNLPSSLNKYSAMLEYQTSEFSRFRLQYNRNETLYSGDGKKQNINSIILEANIAVGAHGAHSF